MKQGSYVQSDIFTFSKTILFLLSCGMGSIAEKAKGELGQARTGWGHKDEN